MHLFCGHTKYLLIIPLIISGYAFSSTPMAVSQSLDDLSVTSEYRYKYNFLLPVYDISLSLPNDADPNQLLEGSYPFALNFHYLMPISKDVVIASAEYALKKNLSQAELDSIKPFIDTLHTSYTSVKKSDRSSLFYCPTQGFKFLLNDALVTSIPNPRFASHYFKIWFGEDPLSQSLKKHLLDLNDN